MPTAKAMPNAKAPKASGTTRPDTGKVSAVKSRPARTGPATAARTAKPTTAGSRGKPSTPGAGRPRVRAVDFTGVVPPAPVPPPLPAAVPDAPAGRALWAALHTHPGARTRPGVTTADLATAAGIGQSTAAQLLAWLATAGEAVRTRGGGGGRTRQPDRWTPTTVPAPVPATDAALVPPLPTAVEDTPAAQALWATLHTHPGARTHPGLTTADLATAAGIGQSTAARLLPWLAEAGHAIRTSGGGAGRTRQPDRWAPTTTPAPVPAPAPATVAGEDAAGTGGARAAESVAVPPGGKLAGGQLRDLVAAHLHAHPDQDFGPTAIGRHLDRSAGAVANACVRLIALGQATQTSDTPRRYRATTK